MIHEPCSSCCRLLGLPRAAWRTSSCLRLSRKTSHPRPCLLTCQKVARKLRRGCSCRASPAALAWLRLAVGVLHSPQLQSRGRLAGMQRQRCERPTPLGQALPQHLLQLVQHGPLRTGSHTSTALRCKFTSQKLPEAAGFGNKFLTDRSNKALWCCQEVLAEGDGREVRLAAGCIALICMANNAR